MSTKYKIMGTDGQEYGPASAEEIRQWVAEHRVDRKTAVLADGARDWAYLEAVPELAALLGPRTPPVMAAGTAPASAGGGLNTVIPYRNMCALFAYYCGVFAVIPFLGIPIGLVGLVLGILGLRHRRRNPQAGGVVHAWIGILAGGFFGFGWLILIICLIAKAAS